jgi:hypothetical protein
VDAANKAMATALSQLTAAAARRDDVMTFAEPRQSMNSGMSAARQQLKAERSAAYGGTRSCSSVHAHAAAVRSAAARVFGAAAQVRATADRVRVESGKVDATRRIVEQRLAVLRAALRAHPSPDVAPVLTQVEQAISGEVRRRKEVDTELAAVEAQARSTSATASQVRSQAGTIQTKAC